MTKKRFTKWLNKHTAFVSADVDDYHWIYLYPNIDGTYDELFIQESNVIYKHKKVLIVAACAHKKSTMDSDCEFLYDPDITTMTLSFKDFIREHRTAMLNRSGY